MSQETRQRDADVTVIESVVNGLSGIYRRNRLAIYLVVVAAVVWTVTSLTMDVSKQIYPDPIYIAESMVTFQDQFVEGARTTIVEITLGLFVGVVLGVAAGITVAESFVVRQLSLPLIILTYSIPHAIFAPLFTVWFGLGLHTVVIFISWFSFYAPFITTITGFTQTPKEFYYLGEVTGATRWQMITKIKLWEALPNIATGVKLSAQASVIGAVIAEFIAGGGGLGDIINQSTTMVETGALFGALFLLMLIGIVFFQGVTFLINRLTRGVREEPTDTNTYY
jgi:NitT/TauT family transport system permease protein